MGFTGTIWFVDDDANVHRLLQAYLKGTLYRTRFFSSGEDLLQELQIGKGFPDAIFSDVRMPGMSGNELLSKVKSLYPQLPFVLMTSMGCVEQALSAYERGAVDYLIKPPQPVQLEILLARLMKGREIQRENEELRAQLSERQQKQILAYGPAMREALAFAERFANVDSPILILGESGTGKELVAQKIHQLSPRSHRPMVSINCASIPESLLESELFGAVKGAFTGAHSHKSGLLAAAHQSTVFLDEIGDMALPLQAKLLRALQEGKIRPVGGLQEIEIDVRVVAATHRNLPQMICKGQFREDLFFRLNVLPIKLPPLRERQEDIEPLAQHFLRRLTNRYGLGEKVFSKKAIDKFRSHSWPGNIRELENTVERAALLANSEVIEDVTICPLPATLSPKEDAQSLMQKISSYPFTLRALEDRYIRHVLTHFAGSKEQAAQFLGIGRKTLYRKEQRLLFTQSTSGKGRN